MTDPLSHAAAGLAPLGVFSPALAAGAATAAVAVPLLVHLLFRKRYHAVPSPPPPATPPRAAPHAPPAPPRPAAAPPRPPPASPRRQVTFFTDLQRSGWANALGRPDAPPEVWQRVLGRADVAVVDTARR